MGVGKLIMNKTEMKIRKLSDKTAKREISKFFVGQVSQGVKRVDVVDVSASLNIPGKQVEKIFYQFIDEGRVKAL